MNTLKIKFFQDTLYFDVLLKTVYEVGVVYAAGITLGREIARISHYFQLISHWNSSNEIKSRTKQFIILYSTKWNSYLRILTA